jgi:hypothetical protein
MINEKKLCDFCIACIIFSPPISILELVAYMGPLFASKLDDPN